MQDQDEVLLSREAQFSELFAERMSDLRGYATYMAGDTFVADDILGEVYLSCVRAIRHGKGPDGENFEFYVRASIRNAAATAHQGRASESSLESLADLEARVLPFYAPDSMTPTWDAETMSKAFVALSQRDRQVLYLAEIERMKHAEIAEKLGIRVNHVSVIVHRAKEALRAKYLECSVASLPNCDRVAHSQIAAFVRGALSGRRLEKLESHLTDCKTCQKAVERMLSLRLPVGVIVALATASGTTLFPSTPAAAYGAAQALWAKMAAKPAVLATYVLAGVVALSLTSVVVAVAQDQPTVSEWIQHAAGSSAMLTSPSDQSGDGESHGTSSQRKGTWNAEIASDPADVTTTQNTAPPVVCPVPEGYRSETLSQTSYDWATPGRDFREGSSGARLSLRLHNAPIPNPEPYLVRISPAPGSTLTNPTNTCTITDGVMTCRVSGKDLAAKSFEIPVTVTTNPGYEAILPRVTLAPDLLP